MFVLKKQASYWYEVKVKQPEGGTLKVFTFQAEFKKLEQPRIQELSRGQRNDRALLDEVWLGWKDIKAKVKIDGVEVEQELPVTPDNRAVLLLEQGVEVALVHAWLDSVVFGPAKN